MLLGRWILAGCCCALLTETLRAEVMLFHTGSADDGTKLGWLQLEVDDNAGIVLHGAAIESIPDRPLRTGVVPEIGSSYEAAIELLAMMLLSCRAT